MSRWPKDNQKALIAFYGDPRTTVPRQLIDVVPSLPFKFTYNGAPVKHMMFHRLCAPALVAAWQKVWNYYGQDQALLDRLHISRTAGTFNPRMIRGSDTQWSNHAFGGAQDVDAEENQMNTGHGHMPLPVVAAFKSEDAEWGGDYLNRTDPMHFEFVDRGRPHRTFEQWLDYYHCEPQYNASPVVRFADVADTHSNGIVTGDAELETDPAEGQGVAVDLDAPLDTLKPATDKKVVTARTLAGTATTIVAAGQAAKTMVGDPGEAVEQINEVVNKSGEVIKATKQVISVPKPGMGNWLLHFVTSPEFVLSMVIAVALAWFLVWWLQRQHRLAGNP